MQKWFKKITRYSILLTELAAAEIAASAIPTSLLQYEFETCTNEGYQNTPLGNSMYTCKKLAKS